MPTAQDSSQKISIKISKVIAYWEKSSLLIPNVFRLARLLEDDPLHLFEHQDLSRKEVLVQSNGQKARGSLDDANFSSNTFNNLLENETKEGPGMSMTQGKIIKKQKQPSARM